MHKSALVLAIGLVTTLVGADFVFADTTIYSQLIDSAVSTSFSGSSEYQDLGTGLTGVLNEVSMETQNQSNPGSYDEWQVTLALTSGPRIASSACVNFQGTGTGKVQSFFTFSSPPALDPTQSYRLIFENFNCAHSASVSKKYYGSSSNVWSGGSFQNIGGNIADAFFIMNGIQTSNATPNTYNNFPSQGTIASSTQVTMVFSYAAPTEYSINQYDIQITDVTASQVYDLTGTISATSGSVSRTVTLTQGHTYHWVAYICSTGGTCYGGPAPTFGVVIDSFQYWNSVLVSATSTTGSGVYGATSTINPNLPIPSFNDATATTSGANALGGFANIPAFLADRVPFGYIFQLRDIISAAATSSDEFGALAVDFQSMALPTTSKAFLPGRVVFFSTTTVTTYMSPTILNTFNVLAGSAITIAWAFYMRRRAMGLLQPV